MAGRSRTLKIEILGDAKGLSKAFGEAERKAGGFGATIGKGAGIAALGIASVGVAAVGAAAIFGPRILEMGGQLEALGVKSKTVFEDSVADVESWAEKNAKAMGLTNEQLVGAAAGFGDLIKPMGFTAAEAAKMSTEALDLSGALSAWTGGTRSAAEVSEILAKAMLGERDGLKELGISISEADVQARLLKNGQDGLTGAALEQAKALATQQLIMEKSADAQEAWNNGSMDGIKAQNEMKASMASLQQGLVQALYPAMQAIVPVITEVATWLGENLPVAMDAVKKWTDENWPKIRDAIVTALEFVSGYIEGFVTTVTALWQQHGDRIMTQVMTVWEYVKATVESAMKVIQGVIDVVMGLIRGDWSEVWEGIKGIVDGIWSQIRNLVETAMRTIGLVLDMAWETIKGIFRDAWESIKSTVSSGVSSMVGFITGIPGRILGTVSSLWDGLKLGIDAAKDYVKLGIDAIVGFVTGLPGRIARGIGDGFNALWDNFKAVINRIIDGINSVRLPGVTIGGWDPPGPGPEIPSFTTPALDPFPNINRLHTGGFAGGPTFAGMADDEVAAILRRDEVVLTPGQAAATARGGGGATYIVNVSAPPNVDMVAVGRVTVEAIKEFEQVAGDAWRGN